MAPTLFEQFGEVIIAKRKAQEAIEALPRDRRATFTCLMLDLDNSLRDDLRGTWAALSRVEQLACEAMPLKKIETSGS